MNDENGATRAEPPPPFKLRARLLVGSRRDVRYVVIAIELLITLEKARHSVEPSRQL
jgi:hypothetical protein